MFLSNSHNYDLLTYHINNRWCGPHWRIYIYIYIYECLMSVHCSCIHIYLYQGQRDRGLIAPCRSGVSGPRCSRHPLRPFPFRAAPFPLRLVPPSLTMPLLSQSHMFGSRPSAPSLTWSLALKAKERLWLFGD